MVISCFLNNQNVEILRDRERERERERKREREREREREKRERERERERERNECKSVKNYYRHLRFRINYMLRFNVSQKA